MARQADFVIQLMKNRAQSALVALRGRLADSGLAIDSIRYGFTPVTSDKNGPAVADALHQLAATTLAFVHHRLRLVDG